MGDNKKKGDLLEELVALLHEVPGLEVERKAQVPVVPTSGSETREIDVLLKGSLAGYPIHMAIECKNWGKAIGVDVVDGFVGKLKQIGFASAYGIIVSASGHSKPARIRAQQAGIRLLDFEGLTADRMEQIVDEAFQSIVYVTLTWERLSTLPIVPESDGPTIPGAIDIRCERTDNEPDEFWGIRAVWEHWRTGRIPLELGEHTAFVREPKTGSTTTSEVTVDLLVHGHVFTTIGEARVSKLKNTETKKLERARLDVRFEADAPGVSIGRMTTEEDLEEYVKRGPVHIMHGRVRVPRMEVRTGWYPPSKQAMIRFKQLTEAGEEPTFEKVEGLNLLRAWDEPVRRDDLSP